MPFTLRGAKSAVNSVARRVPLFRCELAIGVTVLISTVLVRFLEVPEPLSGHHFAEAGGRRGHFPALESGAEQLAIRRP